jgi:hypothetical protein
MFGSIPADPLLYLFLNHFPPVTSEIMINAIATHENTVWSVASPAARKASPKTRKTEDALFLFML